MINNNEESEEYCEFFIEGGWCDKEDGECEYYLDTEEDEGVCELYI